MLRSFPGSNKFAYVLEKLNLLSCLKKLIAKFGLRKMTHELIGTMVHNDIDASF